MASITLKALPASLHRRLKKRAAEHKRSLNQEVIHILEMEIAVSPKLDIEAVLEKERQLHARMKIWATPGEIDRFKREGRK